ncbi:UDP-2,4-diacetamido-2,4,6-trideoxy-beta-L-altropyranose hydrolase [Aliiruegeria haliotis]|uniref:UDP-2,4-diacetamido-2,4, 6-trideoxy-beta-L-altropyranose hydrolase n=1 Tax=Aliiruegeria haliotis TaxID=1280846 RepID=A0A2T0RNE3_9RHOB|nr:UDP-2,4-diacetamido-2,4,6-trideoxy-beta-L-altropyranose hydrolase [Aliiruegeria haliotis]PRY22705.1 UDP-2,4-diacetamido-2,4,6-trideoxy-beta-L-altropyranose hydrolase [Aliiruegeria haliotis]
MGLTIGFRCDASLAIGSGHVMRALTLANALRERGHRCHFLCRDLPGNQNARIAGQGFALHVLPAPSDPVPEGDLAHSDWLGVGWEQDAAESAARLAGIAPDWVVMDHYALDARWQAAAVPEGARLMVQDDLRDRRHRADLLLDQNLGVDPGGYDALVPAGCHRMIGPRYALLRPDFAGLRQASLSARKGRGLGHVMISMGGVDLPGGTAQVLDGLARAPRPNGMRVTVVMGRAAPALEQVRAQAAAMPFPCKVLVDVTDMATLMEEADLAIGGTGGTAWERCCMGLPTLSLVLADNQEAAARALTAAGVALPLGRAGDPQVAERLATALFELGRPGRLDAMSERSAALVDGRGADRVVAALEAAPLELRPAAMADAKTVWQWRRALDPRAFRSDGETPLADHIAWFERALAEKSRALYMADIDGCPAAHLRLDRVDNTSDCALVSILVADARQGQGVGARLLDLARPAARALGYRALRAEVHRDNAASRALFEAAGYRDDLADGTYMTYHLPLVVEPTPVEDNTHG